MRLLLTTLALIILLAVPALAGGGGHASCSGFSEGTGVTLLDSCFEPAALISDGAAVTVRNQGAMPHTYTAVDGSFDSGLLQPGESATIEPAAGLHRVICDLHADVDGAGMSGVLAVGIEDAAELAAAITPAGGTASGQAQAVPSALVPAGVVVALLAAIAAATLLRRRRTAAVPNSPG